MESTLKLPYRSRFAARLLVAAALLPLSSAHSAPDAKRGETLYTARCGACHSLDENGAGPRHRGVFGCGAGTQPGYDYSDALRKSGIVWNVATLDRFLADPNGMVPGNKMAVRLANDSNDRADLIAYLGKAANGGPKCSK